jgi:hypothetical protein
MTGAEGLTVIEKKELYVGCGLTRAPQTFKDEVERTKLELAKDWHVLQFLGTTAGTAADVYRVDILQNVGSCDAFLAIADEPSFGLGWETRESVLLGVPTLLVAHIDANITRMAIGATEFFPGQKFDIRYYEDMVRDVPQIVREEFADLLQ